MTTTIRFGGYQGYNSVHTRGTYAFATALKRQLGENVDFVFERNVTEKGHKAADLLSRTESGDLDGCYFSSSYLTSCVPELGLFDQPFVIADRRCAYALLDGSIGDRLAQEVANHSDYRVLGYWDNGLRHLSCARGPIRQPEDCRGLKIRTLANEDHQRTFRALGFEPVTIDVRDLPAATKDLVVDAQENPLTNIYHIGLHETHRHITLSGHLFGVALILFNQRTVQSWSDSLRRAVRTAIAEATVEQRRMAQADERICARKIQADGAELVQLTNSQRDLFISATAAQVTKMRDGYDPKIVELFDHELARAGA